MFPFYFPCEPNELISHKITGIPREEGSVRDKYTTRETQSSCFRLCVGCDPVHKTYVQKETKDSSSQENVANLSDKQRYMSFVSTA